MIFSSHHDAPVAFPGLDARARRNRHPRRARGSGRIVGPEHRVDVITALKAMTIWPAYHVTTGCTSPAASPVSAEVRPA